MIWIWAILGWAGIGRAGEDSRSLGSFLTARDPELAALAITETTSFRAHRSRERLHSLPARPSSHGLALALTGKSECIAKSRTSRPRHAGADDPRVGRFRLRGNVRVAQPRRSSGHVGRVGFLRRRESLLEKQARRWVGVTRVVLGF